MKFLTSLVPGKKEFYNPVVGHVVNSDLVNYKTTSDLEEVRDILGLQNSAYDFGLQACLVCVNSYPEVLKSAKVDSLIEFIASYKKPNITSAGVKIVPKFNKFSIEFTPFDVVKTSHLIFTYISDKKIELKLGDFQWVCDYESSRNFLDIEFPEPLKNMAFSLEVLGGWSSGSRVWVGLVPNSYPYRVVVDKLKNSLAFTRVANSVGLHDTFISFPELTYQIAIATLAVHKEQLRLIND